MPSDPNIAIEHIADVYGCSELSISGKFARKEPVWAALTKIRNGINEKAEDMCVEGWWARTNIENLNSSAKCFANLR